jgi:hypothetical protein
MFFTPYYVIVVKADKTFRVHFITGLEIMQGEKAVLPSFGRKKDQSKK